jgi:hypothetical protein
MLTVYDANIQIAQHLSENKPGFLLLNLVPENVDSEMAAQLLARDLETNAWRMCKHHENIPLSVIRRYLEMTADMREVVPVLAHSLVSLDLDSKSLRWQWKTFLATLQSLDTSSEWNSKSRKTKIASMASHAEVLGAIQAAVSLGKPVKLDLLAVLVSDASEASLDSLMPHFHDSIVSRDARLDSLAKLKVHAKNSPQMNAFFAQVQATLTERNESSPALELASFLGFKDKTFWFRFTFWSKEVMRNGMSKVQGGALVDSRQADWFRLSMTQEIENSKSQWTRIRCDKLVKDDFGLGLCELKLMPIWISNTAAQLKIHFEIEVVSASVRGKKRDALAQWLVGSGKPSVTSNPVQFKVS